MSLQNVYIENIGKASITKGDLGIKIIVTLRIPLIVIDDTGIFLDHRLVGKSTY